jgi:hypothetical protein
MAGRSVAGRGNDIIVGPFRLHATGLTPIGKPTFAEWLACGRFLHQMEKHVHFWIGDWLAYGEVHFREEYKDLVAVTGYSYHTLRRDKYLAERIPVERRRSSLSVAIHHEAAPLDEPRQEWLLKRAEAEQWSIQRTRQEKRMLVEEYPVAPAAEQAQLNPWTNRIHQADVLRLLRVLPDACVDMILLTHPLMWASCMAQRQIPIEKVITSSGARRGLLNVFGF